MNENTLKITHAEIEITYDEYENLFVFELRGREKKAKSLREAKQMIDAPPPKEKVPFDRVEVWLRDYNKWKRGIVTSIAEPGRYTTTRTEVWVVSGGRREKIYADCVYPITPDNDAAVDKINELRARVESIEKEITATQKAMKSFSI